jgi:hypothetical protein
MSLFGYPGLKRMGMQQRSTAAAPSTSVSPNWAIAAAVFGDLTRGYASFAEARARQEETKAQASFLGHRARMLEMDRRAAMRQAESILEAGQSEIGRVTLEGGQRRAAIEASQAARGVEAGVGSAAEVMASERLMQQAEVYHINLSAVRQASAARQGAVAIGNEALFSRTSSRSLRRSARRAAPEAALLGGAASAGLSAAYLSNYRRS